MFLMLEMADRKLVVMIIIIMMMSDGGGKWYLFQSQ